MLVETQNKPEARRLQLDGYSRTGSKAVEAPFDQLESILERDDVSVSKVSIHRKNSEKEGNVVDQYVRAQVPDRNYDGRVERTFFTSTHSRQKIKTRTNKILEASEDSVTVYRMFRETLLEAPMTHDIVDEESFREAREARADHLEEQIQELEEKLEEVKELTVDDLLDE